MGNKSSKKSKRHDAIDKMNQYQRVIHLICGYVRVSLATKQFEHNPTDISSIIQKFIGYQFVISSPTEILDAIKFQTMWKKQQMKLNMPLEVSMCIVGDVGVGKSNLLIRFVTNNFLEEYDPTIECGYRKQILIDDIPCIYDVYDYNQYYEDPKFLERYHCFLWVYSITKHSSFVHLQEIIEDQKQQIEDWDKTKYGIVVGSKCDLNNQREVPYEKGYQLAVSMGKRTKFMEVSAKEDVGILDCFKECGRMYAMYELLGIDK